jgi:predicted HicB family RNase H-like nuclease
MRTRDATINVSLPSELKEWAVRKAAEDERSLSSYVVTLLIQARDAESA